MALCDHIAVKLGLFLAALFLEPVKSIKPNLIVPLDYTYLNLATENHALVIRFKNAFFI